MVVFFFVGATSVIRRRRRRQRRALREHPEHPSRKSLASLAGILGLPLAVGWPVATDNTRKRDTDLFQNTQKPTKNTRKEEKKKNTTNKLIDRSIERRFFFWDVAAPLCARAESLVKTLDDRSFYRVFFYSLHWVLLSFT